MKELEKILEEINRRIDEYVDHDYVRGSGDVVKGLSIAKSIIRKHINDGWISVEERLPTVEECEKENNEFFVQTDSGERFSCEYDPLANGYDNPSWCCNVPVIAWRPLPETYKPERSDNNDGE